MLKIRVVLSENFDEVLEKFVYKEKELLLEHSLYSISKWEEKWKKPFLKKDYKMTTDEMLDYIHCMVVDEKDLEFLDFLSEKNVMEIANYINDSATATTFNDNSKRRRGSTVTSEVIYTKMILCGVPFETQHWHLNRLITLLRVIDAKANPKKMTKQEIMARNYKLNQERHQKYGIKE